MHLLILNLDAIRVPGEKAKAKGTIYLSNIRMVFVSNKPNGSFTAFDMPLVWNNYLHIVSLSPVISLHFHVLKVYIIATIFVCKYLRINI